MNRAVLTLSIMLLLSPFLLFANLGFGPISIESRQLESLPASAKSVTTPSIVTIPNRQHVLIGQEVAFYLSASSDVVGTTLNFTIYYDYRLADGSINPESPYDVVTSENPGEVVTYFTYYSIGNCTTYPIVDDDPYYVIRVFVDDGVSPTATGSLILWVYDNTAPYFTLAPPSTIQVDWGEEIDISFTVADFDNDTLDVVWDFGDGSPLATNSTDSSLPPVTFSQLHAWTPATDPGDILTEYYYCEMEIAIVDSEGNYLNASIDVTVILPHNFSPVGNITAEKKLVDPSEELDIYANVRDYEGDAITWTFELRNGTAVTDVRVFHTPATTPNTTVWNNVSYVLGAIGNYSVRLYFSDAVDPALQVGAHNKSVSVSGIVCANNSIPYVLGRISATPGTAWLNETTWTVEVMFYLEIADADGDNVTLTWDFDDGSPTVTNTSENGAFTRCVQYHVFTQAAQFNVTATATDGWYGHEILRWRLVNISSNNSSPRITYFDIIHTNESYSEPGDSVGFFIVFTDREFDPINVTIDFGDGSEELAFYLDEFNETGHVVLVFNHTYEATDDYTLWINFTDNKFGTYDHDERWHAVVKIYVEKIRVPRVWNIWDYVGLAILCGIFVSLVSWAVLGVRKRKILDTMGITWEEYNLRKSEMDLKSLKAGDKGEKGGGT